MKKQGIWVLRFFALLLFLFVVGYMGYHVFDAVYDPISRADAVLQEIEEVIPLTGIFVREEKLISRPDGIVKNALGEGERVGMGQTLAYVYSDASVLEKSERQRELDMQLGQLTYEQEHGQDLSDITALDTQISKSVISTLNAAYRGRYSSLDTFSLKSLVFKREFSHRSDADFSPMILGLTNELNNLSSEIVQAVTAVAADESGAFSSVADGYESVITPDMLEHFLPSDYDALSKRQDIVPDMMAMGKLVTDFRWYYASPVSEEYARLLKKGSLVTLRFAGDYAGHLVMRVDRVGEPENGRVMLVFSTKYNVSEYIDMRFVTADLISKTYKGIRVPREAVRLNGEGETGVYCVVVNAAVWKPVDIFYEGDNYFLAAYDIESSGTGMLLPGDEIIVAAKDLYDGKIIQG